MNLRGGLIPLVAVKREVHVVDGATYRFDVTWFRRGFLFEYHTPNIPRAIRKERAREMARVRAAVAAELQARA